MNIEIVIPTKDRAISLDQALSSLTKQTRLPSLVTIVDGGSVDNTHDVVKKYSNLLNIKYLQSEPGLIVQMNKALSSSSSDIFVRTDDDVIFEIGWVEGIRNAFSDPAVLGVTGPTCIPTEFQNNRDLMRLIFNKGFGANLKRIIYNFYCDGKMYDVGYWSRAALFSIGTNVKEKCPDHCVDVEYLEACNFAVRTSCLKEIGGFSEVFSGIGEYHEPDACFRLKNKFNQMRLIYSPDAALQHCPSLKGFFNERNVIYPRIENYINFVKKYKDSHIKSFSAIKFRCYLFTIVTFFSLSVRTKRQFVDLIATFRLILMSKI